MTRSEAEAITRILFYDVNTTAVKEFVNSNN